MFREAMYIKYDIGRDRVPESETAKSAEDNLIEIATTANEPCFHSVG